MYDQCIKLLKEHLLLSYEKDLIIDPNADANNQEFMDGIQSLTKRVLFYNKNPGESDSVMPLDFLQIDFERFNKTFLSGLWFDAVHIVSEPPPEQAVQYIKAACKFAESVSLIMPKDAVTAFPLSYQCLFSMDLPATCKKNKDLVFQTWLKADY